jgi:histidyl-tRNA synthetase
MGDVVLGELLRSRGLMPHFGSEVDVWVASAHEGLEVEVMRLATELRYAGRSVEYALRELSLPKQFKAAGSAGAHTIAVLSREDVDAGTVALRWDGAPREAPPPRVPRARLLDWARGSSRTPDGL